MSQRQQAEALVHIDEPQVRVTEYLFQPGAETGWHRRMADYVVVPLLDGTSCWRSEGAARGRRASSGTRPTRGVRAVEHNGVSANETGKFSGVRRVGVAAWGGTPKARGDQAFEIPRANDHGARR
jgi:hypothetical protein